MSAQALLIYLLFALIPTTVSLILLVKEYIKNRKHRLKIDELSKRLPENLDLNSQNLLYSAQKKADEIVSQAEMDALKITAESKMISRSFEQQTEKNIEQHIAEADNEYRKFLQFLEQQSQNSQEETQEVFKQKVSEMLLKFDQSLSEFLSSSQQKSMQALELEIRSARELIDNYKVSQLKIIDENIIAVLERTLSLVIKKKLTLNDQMDLVFEGLEKAKIEKFFS